MAANDRVGNVYLDVLPKGDSFNAGVQALINQAEKKANFNVKANTGDASKAVDQLGKDITDKLGNGFAQAALQAAGFTAAIFAVRETVNGVVDKMGDLFDVIAKARAGFGSILGSSSEGEKLLQQVRQFAIQSPFATNELVQYSQQLLGVGKAADTIVPTLQSVGDIVASVGGDTSNLGSILYALTQIQTIGKLTGQDARQLQNQLVPITKYIADYTHQSVADVKKLQEAGGIASDTVFAAITNQGERVKGALNASVRTISGAKNVIKDTVENLFQSNAGVQGIFDDIVKGIQAIDTALLKPEVLKPIEDAITAVTNVYKDLKPVIEGFINLATGTGFSALHVITEVFGAVSDVIKLFPTGALKLIGEALGALALAKAPLALIRYAESIKTVASGLLGFGGASKIASIAVQSQTVAVEEATAVSKQYTDAEILAAVATKELTENYSLLTTQMVATIAEGERLAAQMTATSEATAAANAAGGGGVGGAIKRGLGNNKVQAGLGIGLTIGGQALQDNTAKTNTLGQGAGKAAQFAGYGLLLGGPAGAAAGAALGAVTGYIDASEAQMQEHIDKSKKLGEDAATAYLKTNEKLFESATSDSANEIIKKRLDLASQAASIRTRQFKENTDIEGNLGTQILSLGNYGSSKGDQISDFFKKNQVDLAAVDAQLKATGETYDKIVTPIFDAVKQLDAADHAKNFFDTFKDDKVRKDINGISDAFRDYGLTLQDVVEKGAPAVVELVTLIDGLDTSQKRATVSANLLAAAIKDASADSTAIFGTQVSNATAKVGALNAANEAITSAVAAQASGQTKAAKQVSAATAEQNKYQAESAVRTQTYAQSIVDSDRRISDAKKAGNDDLAKSLENGKVQLATDTANAAVQDTLNNIIKAQTTALFENTEAREANLKAAARAKIGTDIASAQTSLSSLQTAGQARAGALGGPASQTAQLAAQKALFDAQEAAGNEAAAKASDADRKQVEAYTAIGVASDDQVIKNLNNKIRLEEENARSTAQQKVLNEVTAQGTALLALNSAAVDRANIAAQKAVDLAELQNRSATLSANTGAIAARTTAIRRPDDETAQIASQLASNQAAVAAGNEAAFKSSEKLVAFRKQLIDLDYDEHNIAILTLNDEIAKKEATARTVAETAELAKIEHEASIARTGYNAQTITFLENLAKAQIAAQAIYGDEVAKASALSGFAAAIDTAAQAANAYATAASSKIVKGDIFSGVIDQSTIAARNLQAVTVQQSQATLAFALGANAAQQAANGLIAYNAVLEASSVNFDDITKKVTGMNKILATVDGSGQAAIVTATSQAVAQTQAALNQAQNQIAALQPKGGRNSDDTVGVANPDLLTAIAESKKQQHILDILAGRAPDDLGVLSSLSAGAQAIIQPQLDQAAAQKAKEAADKLLAYQDKVTNATNTLIDRLTAAALSITAAAEKWTGSIKERTQYEAATSVGRLTRNATQQTQDIGEITSGLANLRSRGVSDAVLKALGIDSVADVRQVRKLVKSSDSDLAKLTSAVGQRGVQATALAASEVQAAQKKTITDAILDAAKTLGVESNFSREQATALANTLDINVNMDPAAIAAAFIATLSGAKIG